MMSGVAAPSNGVTRMMTRWISNGLSTLCRNVPSGNTVPVAAFAVSSSPYIIIGILKVTNFPAKCVGSRVAILLFLRSREMCSKCSSPI